MTAIEKRPSTPRLILVDDNIRNVGGHFLELATLMLSGGVSLGYHPVMATHDSFDQFAAVPKSWTVIPSFGVRRMLRWSMGVDGQSKIRRDLSGKPTGVTAIERLQASFGDWMTPPAKRPTRMLAQWSADFCELIGQVKPRPTDSLLINTGDDFAMLALAAALRRVELPAMRIDVIFHFTLSQDNGEARRKRLRMIGQQLAASIASMKPHHICLHATTPALASQLRDSECGVPVTAIPYPTRRCEVARSSTSTPIKAVLAGLPRAEKGRDAIAGLIAGIETTLLKSRRVRLSMQMPAQRWESMIPKSMHRSYKKAMDAAENDIDPSGPLEVKTSNLTTADYHRWLDSADLGLFLYDAERYVARCSGVLLEMMARGIPVIVPDRCWLADQVRLAGGHRSIGFIYQHRDEIPELMRQFVKHRAAIQTRAIAHAATVAERHAGENTLRAMGFQSVGKRHAA